MSLLVLAVGALVGIAVVEALVRRSDVGVGLVLALLLLRESTPHIDLSVLTSPVRVGPPDLVVVVLLAAAAARLLRARRLTVPQRFILVMLALIFWSIARGAGAYAMPTAVAEGRKFLQVISALLYFSTVEFRRDLFDRFGKLWLLAASALGAITIARWIGNAAGLRSGFFESSATNARVLGASMTLVLAQAALISFPLLLRRDRLLYRLLAPAFLVFVVVLQHRTVWIATIAGTVYLLWRERALAKRALGALTAALVLFGALSLTLLNTDEQDDVTGQLADSAQSTGTLEWRYQGWTALLSDSGPRNTEEVLTGMPFGTGWARALSAQNVVDVSPHNFYLETFLRIGLLGLAALLATYYLALKATRRFPEHRSQDGLLSPSILHVAVAMQMIYSITYSPDFAQAMLLGLAAAVASSNRSHSDNSSPRLENRDAALPNRRSADLPQPSREDRQLSAFHLRSRR
jgi:hypothetical protein